MITARTSQSEGPAFCVAMKHVSLSPNLPLQVVIVQTALQTTSIRLTKNIQALLRSGRGGKYRLAIQIQRCSPELNYLPLVRETDFDTRETDDTPTGFKPYSRRQDIPQRPSPHGIPTPLPKRGLAEFGSGTSHVGR